MDISALLTSAGCNIAICVVVFSLYSILRKQPSNLSVYFAQRLSQLQPIQEDHFCFDRLVPSASWIVKAWEASDEEIYASGGIDAVVFLKIVVFCIRIFSIASIICVFLVLPLNYYGQEVAHSQISSEMDVFTIGNIKEGSKWLWAHCLALYVISGCACILLYFEYKNVARMRLEHIIRSPTRPSHYTVLLRAVPWSSAESYSDAVKNYFTNYYASSYLSHEMVYRHGTVQKLVDDAEKMYKMLTSTSVTQFCTPSLVRCGFCGGTNSFKMLANESGHDERRRSLCDDSHLRDQECAAALVFFRTRYAALVASETLQSPDTMLWVTEAAPEPLDVHWTNLCVPYKLLWIRKILTQLGSVVFMLLFLGPTTFVQGLTYLDKLESSFPFLRKILERRFVSFVTGYLPSVVLMLFLYVVPPIMLLLSTLEGSVSRSGRKMKACDKILWFMIWNVFFANILSGSVIERLGKLTVSSPKELATLLANVVPRQAYFFMTYIMTSGWASLSCELTQPFVLICNWFYKYILRKNDTATMPFTFPYHTEVPRALLLGLFGFTFSVLAPLMLPFLLVYYLLAYLVYRNQILNVYITRYQTGGLYWPMVQKATMFSLILTQTLAAVLFGMKKSSIALGFIVPLIILTFLFDMYCKQRFLPIFKNTPAQVLIEMDRQDEHCGKTEDMLQYLQSAYCQFTAYSNTHSRAVLQNKFKTPVDDDSIRDPEDMKPAMETERPHQSSPKLHEDATPSLI